MIPFPKEGSRKNCHLTERESKIRKAGDVENCKQVDWGKYN